MAGIVGISLALEPGIAAYLPLAHRAGDPGAEGGGETLFENGLAPDQVLAEEALARLKPLFEDPAVLKIGQNLKHDWLVLAQNGIELGPIDDTMLLSYALDVGRPNLSGHGLEQLARDLSRPFLPGARGSGRQGPQGDRRSTRSGPSPRPATRPRSRTWRSASTAC